MCNFGHIGSALVGKNDFLITHFIDHPHKIACRKHILSCHERRAMFPSSELHSTSNWDIVQFVSEHQKKEHALSRPSVVIPPMVQKIKWVSPQNGVFGIIGSIDAHKQPHVAIQKAFEDGADEIRLYGEVTDQEYFDEHMAESVLDGRIKMMNHEDDKEVMYGAVERVYHASKSETYGMVEAECALAGIPFYGPSSDPIVLSDEEILERWKEVLQ
jgi:hypothetical protein